MSDRFTFSSVLQIIFAQVKTSEVATAAPSCLHCPCLKT